MDRQKQFFRNALIYLLLALAVNAVLNAVYDRTMIYHRLNRNQDRQFEEYNDTLTFLMLGNSHDMINPEITGNSFNYASPGEVYTQTYYKLKYILEKTGKIPEYAVLSVDPANFSPKAENTLKFDGYWRKYVDYPALARETGDYDYYIKWFTGRFCAYIGNYKFIYMSVIFLNADFSLVKNGYRPPRDYRNFAREPDRNALGLERATAYLSGYGKKPDKGPETYFRKILSLCRDYDITPVLVRMPLTDEYLMHASKLVDLDDLDRQIEGIAAEETGNYIMIDFREALSGKPELFFNADHVNPRGADIISEKFRAKMQAHIKP